MFANYYQNGSHIMLLEAKGSKPLDIWDTKKAQIQRVFDKTLKTYVLDLTGNHLNTIKCPSVPAHSLAITQNYLAFYMFLPYNQPLTVTLTVQTQQKAKIRLQFSTSIKQIKTSNLLARLPLHVISGTWSLMIFDLYEIVKQLFPYTYYAQLNHVEVSPFCTILRIFSLLQPPLPTVELFCPSDEAKLLLNRKLPPPAFSRRFHYKLSEKLASTIPMHCQIIDQFYITTFEGEAGKDISVRDYAGIIAIREQFSMQMNQAPEEEHNVERSIARVRGVQYASEDVVYRIYENYPTPYKKATTPRQVYRVQLNIEKTPGSAKPTKIPTPGPVAQKPVSAVKTAIDGFYAAHNEAYRELDEAQYHVDQINQRNLTEDFAAQQQKRINANLQRLPQPLKQPEEMQCDEDLTIAGVAVMVQFMGEGKEDRIIRSRDGKEIGLRKQAETNTQQPEHGKTPTYQPDSEQEFPAEGDKINGSLDDDIVQQDAVYDDPDAGAHSYSFYDDYVYEESYEQSNYTNSAEHDAEVEEQSNQSDEMYQDIIPDPADACRIPDPVAFGLYYDPVSKCYYEKETDE